MHHLIVAKKTTKPRREVAALPRNFVDTVERGRRIFEELRSGVTPEIAVSRRREELRKLLGRFDSVHVLGQLMFSEAPMNPDTYVESEHVGAAYVVEMVAAELLGRPGRSGSESFTPAIDANLLEPIRQLCSEAALVESLRRAWAGGGFSNPESAARARAASHHLLMRAPGWPWQEHATLRGLFGEERFAAQLRTKLGFDIEDAIKCSEAVSGLAADRLEQHMNSVRESIETFGPEHPAFLWASRAFQDGWQDAGPEPIRAMSITALWGMNHLGDAMLFDGAALASKAGVSVDAAEGFLTILSLPPGQPEDDWFRRAEAVRLKPFIDFGPDGYDRTPVVGPPRVRVSGCCSQENIGDYFAGSALRTR